MRESQFQQELKKTFEDAGCWSIKIPDSIRTKETRFIPKKCADLIAVVDGTPILIECKQIKEIKDIKFNFFGNTKEKKEKLHWREYHQYKELKKFEKKGRGYAYYAINVRTPNKINKLIFLSMEQFELIYKNDKPITKAQLLELCKIGIQGKKGRFLDKYFDLWLMANRYKKYNFF